MKKMQFLTTIFLLCFIYSSNASDKKFIKSNLREAKLFRVGASLSHITEEINLNPGTHYLAIQQIANFIDVSSIQVKNTLNSDLQIVSISYENHNLDPQVSKNAVYTNLNNRFKVVKKELQEITKEINAEQAALRVLEANMKIGGNQAISQAQLSQTMDYYRVQYKSIYTKLSELDENEKKQKELVQQIENELNRLGTKEHNPGQIILKVFATKNLKAKFDVSYFTNRVNWSPTYDTKFVGLDKNLEVNYKAAVYQHTGIDWENIKLSFSSAMPTNNNNIPVQSPWWLKFHEPNKIRLHGISMNKAMASPDYELEESMADAGFNMVESSSMLQNSFDITSPYTIYTHEKNQEITLKNLSIPAEYTYYAVPKANTNTFLIAKIKDWEQYNLLPGQNQLIVDNVYAGKSYLNPNITEEEMQISLGKDERIVTSYERINEKGSKAFLGSTQKREFSYEVTIKNTRNQTIETEIKDNFPLSTDKDITIDLIEVSKASVDKDKGELTWNISLKPNETKKLTVKYSVSYPKNKNIQGL